jgi:transcriptional regulator GlxA family with amidase domain
MNERAMITQETTFERHYSVEELCELWNMSDDFVRRLFLKEPGVVVFHHARPGRRVYRTLRIPASVAERVHRRMRRDRDSRY